MATLRATQFAAGAITGTAVTNIYTVPAGHKIILKSISVLNAGGVATNINVRKSAFGSFRNYALAAFGAAGCSVTDHTWIVFEAGDVIQINSNVNVTYTYVICGSLMVI